MRPITHKPHTRSKAFNWGYDPVLYGVPEGSYSSDPDGMAPWLLGGSKQA